MLEAYGLVSEDLVGAEEDAPPLRFGERAFEIALARSGTETTWFDRHEAAPVDRVAGALAGCLSCRR